MILLIISAFFCWLIFHEISTAKGNFDTFSKGYLLVTSLLALAFAWPSIKTWRFESYLSEKASIVADKPGVEVKCNSVFDSIFSGQGLDNNLGTARIEDGKIFFENSWCYHFMDYLDDPVAATGDKLIAMHVFTHEIMHARGERNEAKTDCQAIQRNHIVGELLDIPQRVARKNAQRYYLTIYPRHPYASKDCVLGGLYDEQLFDSIWE